MKDEKDIFSYNGDTGSNNLRNDDIYSRLDESSDMEDADEDLLALLDMISAQDEKQKNNNIPQASSPASNPVKAEEPVKEETSSIFSIDDFNLENDDSQGEDYQNGGYQNEDLQREEIFDSFVPDKVLEANPGDNSLKSKSLDNVGDIFSDALSAMDRLEDEELLNNMEETNKEKDSKEKSGVFSKLFSKNDKKDKKETDKNSKIQIKEEKKKEKAKAKDSKEKDSREKAAKAKPAKEKKKPAEELLTAEEKLIIEKKKEAKAKKAAAKAEKKKANSAKKAEKQKAAAEKAAMKQQKKQEKKEQNTPDPEDNIKLNTLGVVFIMTFFILIAGIVIVGTNTYSYSLGLRNANLEYSRGRYTQAYYEIYGLNIKKQDHKIYDKIMTTMYVNKELNSYYNYKEMNKYPEALDSLLKGLNRYDTHIDHAKELGIENNLNAIKKQLLKELKKSYGLTEKQARAINSIDDKAIYSVKVINLASEKK